MIFENCGSWTEIGEICPITLQIAVCSNFYEIWHLVQFEHANYEYGTCELYELMILTQNYRFGQILSKHWNLFQFLWNLTLTTIEHANYQYKTRHGLESSRDYWLRMIIGCKIRLTSRTWLIAITRLSLKRGFGRCGHGFGGVDGFSGFNGFSGFEGFSGFNGFDGFSGFDGISGFSGFDGFSGFGGFSLVYSATKGFISCAELPSDLHMAKGWTTHK